MIEGETSGSQILMSSVLFAVIGFLTCFAYLIYKAIRSISRNRWYAPNTSSDWMSVNLVLSRDPLEINSSSCGQPFTNRQKFQALWIISFAISISLLVGWLAIPYLWLPGKVPTSLQTLLEIFKESEINFTTAVPISGIAVALVTLLVQTRAKLSAENRKVWLDQVRLALAESIEALPTDDGREKNFKLFCNPSSNLLPTIRKRSPTKNDLSRIKLELLINPTEKDHRALSTLLRIAYGITDPAQLELWFHAEEESREQDFQHILEIDRIVYENIPAIRALSQEAYDQKNLITLIIRLSNALLKREWERVKQGI